MYPTLFISQFKAVLSKDLFHSLVIYAAEELTHSTGLTIGSALSNDNGDPEDIA